MTEAERKQYLPSGEELAAREAEDRAAAAAGAGTMTRQRCGGAFLAALRF